MENREWSSWSSGVVGNREQWNRKQGVVWQETRIQYDRKQGVFCIENREWQDEKQGIDLRTGTTKELKQDLRTGTTKEPKQDLGTRTILRNLIQI